jgi:hypothetical protein
MKLERKKGVKSFKIVGHNKKLLAWIIFLVIIFVFVVWSLIRLPDDSSNREIARECLSDSDCIPSSCCHSASCMPRSNFSKCASVMCTTDCRPDTMDCGQGSCVCVNNKCNVQWSK